MVQSNNNSLNQNNHDNVSMISSEKQIEEIIEGLR